MSTHTDTLLASAELQDNVLIALNDLERLQTLLDDSHEALQAGFFGLIEHVGGDAQVHLKNAMKALQFQDMATQLIAHTAKRLRHCADRLARDAFTDDGDDDIVIEAAPSRPNPVTQSEMDTGFVELF
jgi:hypothetical protein